MVKMEVQCAPVGTLQVLVAGTDVAGTDVAGTDVAGTDKESA